MSLNIRAAALAGLIPTTMFVADVQPAESSPPVNSWREANDLVRHIGGWQAYAHEAQAGSPAGSASSSSSARPASGTAGGNEGHLEP